MDRPGDPDAGPPGASLRQRSARAVVWSAVESWGSKASSMVVFIVLARLLTPADFGLVASANVVIQLVQVLVVAGFAEAIVQRKDLRPGQVQAGFAISAGLGLILAAAVIAVAVPLGSVLGDADVVPVIRAMSAVFFLQGLASVPRALLQRELRFASMAARSVIGSLIGGVAGITAAIMGAGVWSLVIQVLVDATLGTAVIYSVTRFVPTGRFTRDDLRSLLGFSLSSLATDIVNVLHRRSDDLVVAWRLGPTALGYYSVGYRFMRLFDDMISKVLFNVSFPVFAKLQADKPRLRDAYLQASRLASIFIVPTFAGLSLCAPEIILVFFGDKWVPAGPVMRALSVAGLMQGVQLFSLSVLKARGAMTTVLRFNAGATAVFILGFLIAAPYGITAVAVTYAVMVTVASTIPPLQVARELGFSPRLFVGAIGPAFLAMTAMAPVVLFTRRALSEEAPILRLGAGAVAGGIAYAVVLWWATPDLLGLIRQLLAGTRSPKTRTVSDLGTPA